MPNAFLDVPEGKNLPRYELLAQATINGLDHGHAIHAHLHVRTRRHLHDQPGLPVSNHLRAEVLDLRILRPFMFEQDIGQDLRDSVRDAEIGGGRLQENENDQLADL